MIRFDEYRQWDAVAMATLVQKGEVTALELLECAHARHCAVKDDINAIINPMFFNAHRYLNKQRPQGTLQGVPIVLKDLLGHFPGVPTSGGSRSSQYIMQTVPSTLYRGSVRRVL